MAFIRKIMGLDNKEIILEFTDNWNEDTELTQPAEKELFLQKLMTELCRMITKLDGCRHFQLTGIALAEGYYKVLLNQQNSYDIIAMIAVPFPCSEQKAVLSPERELITQRDTLIAAELEIDLAVFASWKKEFYRLAAYLTDSQTQTNHTMTRLIQDIDSWFKHDSSIKKQVWQNMHSINNQIQEKQQDLSILELRLENIADEYYRAHLEKMQPLLKLKEDLIKILRQTALAHYCKILKSDGTIDPVNEKFFNELFKGITQIENHQIYSEIYPTKLKDIANLFNAFLQQMNTFYNRWLALRQVEPLAVFAAQLQKFSAEYQANDKIFHYKNFSFTLENKVYAFEQETETQCAAIRKTFAETYVSCTTQFNLSCKEQINALTRTSLTLANYIEAKKLALQRSTALPSHPTDEKLPCLSIPVIAANIPDNPSTAISPKLK